MTLVGFAFSLVAEEVFKFNRDLCFGVFFHGWGGTESCSTLGSCSGLGISAWGVVSEYWKGFGATSPL